MPLLLDRLSMEEMDSNNKGAISAVVNGAGKTMFTAYVCGVSGRHGHHHVVLDASPDSGENWFEVDGSEVDQQGTITVLVVCDEIRARVEKAEGAASKVKVSILGA